MGDRANVVIKKDAEQVCLYTHWHGYELPGILQSSLKRGKDRIYDFQYLNRIIFCDMIKGHEEKLTGFGITQKVHDGATQVITLDMDKKTVQINGSDPVSFDDFMAAPKVGWSADEEGLVLRESKNPFVCNSA